MVNLLAARVITITITVLMMLLFLKPLAVGSLYLILRPLVQPFAYHHYTLVSAIPLTSILSIFLIIIAYYSTLINQKNAIWHIILTPLYGLLTISFISIVNTPSYPLFIAGVLKILCSISMYVLIYNAIQGRSHLRAVLWSLLLSSLVPMLMGYYQFITKTGHAWKSAFYAGTRPDSCFGEWNIYGEFLCICIVATLMLFLLEKTISKKKMFFGIVLISLMCSLLISLNRGSWVSLAAGVFFSTIIFIDKIKLRWIIITGIIISISMGGFIYKRFQQLDVKKEGYSQNTLQGRIDYWKKLTPLIVNNPIIGHGIGSSVIIGDRYFKKGMAPHNDYLRLALEIGIPGALIYLIFLGWVFLKEIDNFRKKRWEISYPMLILIVYVIVLSTFQNIIYNVTIFPMFMALLAVSHKSQVLRDIHTNS